MLRTAFVITLTLLAVLRLSGACRCPHYTDKKKVCAADSVYLVYIKDRGTVIEKSRRYKVEFLYQYKTDKLLGPAVDSEYVYTPIERSKCGVVLQEGALYVISGRYVRAASIMFRFLNSRMTTTLCDLHEKFNPEQPYVPPKC